MSRATWVAVACGLGLLPAVFADGPAAPSSVEQLIRQLGSRDFKVRDAATRALAALGADALPALQKGRATDDPEVRRRLDEIIPPLERAITLAPRRVTLHMTNRPLKDVLAEIGKQTGYKLLAEGNVENDKTVHTFHFDKVSFWEALDKVGETTGMVLQQNFWGDDSLRLTAQDSYVPFASYNGPFKVVATGFSYSRNINFGQLPRNPNQGLVPGGFFPGQQNYESLQLSLTIFSEPKLPILRLGAVRLSEATDEDHRSMLPSAYQQNQVYSQRYYYGGGYRGFMHQAQAPLIWASKNAHLVKTLKGVIPVTLLADQKPTVVTDKFLTAKGKKLKAGPATFHIEDITEVGGNVNKQYQVKMSVTEEVKDANPNDFTRVNSLQQRMELQDDKGNEHHFYFNSIGNSGPSSAQFTFTIQPNNQPGGTKLGPPTRLVYYSWVLMEHEVPFEFKDLPLP